MNGTITDRLRRARRVHFDSMTLIYLIEQHQSYGPLVREAFALVDSGRCVGLSSFVTLVEVLVRPLREQRLDVAEEYRNILLHSRHFTLFPVDRSVAELAAKVRADDGMRTPDAIQLATAICHRADVFLTNDKELGRFDQLEVIVLDEFADPEPT